MISIRRVFSSFLQKETISQVQEIFRRNFSAVSEYAEKIPLLLNNPFQYGYRTILLVVQDGGYNLTNLKQGSVAFFKGLSARLFK